MIVVVYNTNRLVILGKHLEKKWIRACDFIGWAVGVCDYFLVPDSIAVYNFDLIQNDPGPRCASRKIVGIQFSRHLSPKNKHGC